MQHAVTRWALALSTTVGPALAATQDALEGAVGNLRNGGIEQAATPGALLLAQHDVDVVINNGFAATTIDQVLENPTDSVLEATWAFPLPDEAALSELSLWIGEDRVIGEVVKKDEARRIYEEESKAGESSALAEQNGYVDYRVSINRVPARGSLRVRVVYFQPLDVDQGVGRYLYPLQDGNTGERREAGMDTSFWSMDREVSREMTLDVTLKTAFPIDGLHSPSHAAATFTQVAEDEWSASWRGAGAVLDRDFILHYRLAEDVPARIELLTSRFPGQAEGTFMAVVTPGDDLAPIADGTDWMFVLDVSGSMKGDKLRVLQQGVAQAIERLRPEDRFQVLAFNNGHRFVGRDWSAPGSPAAEDALARVRELQADGGTNIFGALDAAYAKLDADRPSAIILVSDGVANTGPHEYRDFIAMAKRHDGRLFTFVMGNGANERLLGDLAALSGGFAKSVSVQDEVGAHLMLARERMSHEAMHGVEFHLDRATVTVPELLPSLYLGQQLVVFGRYAEPGPSKLTVRAKISGERREWTVPVELPAIDEANPELGRLYALAAIADLERKESLAEATESEVDDAITDMAIAYGLVTDHTSMVVVAEGRKAAYGLGHANADRRAREESAAATRVQTGSQVQTRTDGQPLAGGRAAHAPSREARRRSGGGGGGALGPLELVGVLSIVGVLAARQRRERDEELGDDGPLQ
jgi:Ca-activated chloride channel family protein